MPVSLLMVTKRIRTTALAETDPNQPVNLAYRGTFKPLAAHSDEQWPGKNQNFRKNVTTPFGKVVAENLDTEIGMDDKGYKFEKNYGEQ